MKSRSGLTTWVCLLLAMLVPTLAQADDSQAQRLYHRAVRHWKDPDPTKTENLLNQAIDAADSKTLRMNLLRILGQFHQGKTGDFGKALKCYDRIIMANIGVKDPKLKQIKAMALLNKGTILYSQSMDVKRAVDLYQSAHATFPTAWTADCCSQMTFRLARSSTSTQAIKDMWLKKALALSNEALKRNAKDTRKNPAVTAKYQLQQVIVLTALGKIKEASKVWNGVNKEKLTVDSLYQQAVLLALEKAEPKAVGDMLRRCLDPKVRPKARARNQLRKFIRTEADFKVYRRDPSWKDLVTDEGKKATSRPSR